MSTFGYGGRHGDYDPELLEPVARACGGSFYHIDNPDAVAAALGKELGSLLTVVAQSVRLRLEARPNVTVTGVLNDVDVATAGAVTTIELGDMFAEQERALVVRAQWPSFTASVAGTRPRKHVMTIHAEWIDTTTGAASTASQDLHLEFVAPGAQQLQPDPEVQKQAALLVAAEKQREALKAADGRDFDKARGIMQEALALLAACVLYAQDRELQLVHRRIAELEPEFTYFAFNAETRQKGTGLRRSMESKRGAAHDPEMAAMYEKGAAVRYCMKMVDDADEILQRKRAAREDRMARMRQPAATQQPAPPAPAQPVTPAPANGEPVGFTKTRRRR